MALKMKAMFVMGLAIAISLVSVASAISGTATFYNQYLPSACDGFQDDGVMIAAASDSIWDNGAACGRKYSVSCTSGTNQGVAQPCRSGTVTVKIVDRCPLPACRGTIDLSLQAFSAIADPNEGKINIEYTQVGKLANNITSQLLTIISQPNSYNAIVRSIEYSTAFPK
ncbi:hypothetical protein K1719_003132 [Acacia pycnantha]|nr:hypothetical protein K1719_003132 [Acacia pycnantha]